MRAKASAAPGWRSSGVFEDMVATAGHGPIVMPVGTPVMSSRGHLKEGAIRTCRWMGFPWYTYDQVGRILCRSGISR